jgi:hypothetical protein
LLQGKQATYDCGNESAPFNSCLKAYPWICSPKFFVKSHIKNRLLLQFLLHIMDSFSKYLRDLQEAVAESLHEQRQRERMLIPQPSSTPKSGVDLDLDLKSGWYARNPPTFPPQSINRLPGSRIYASSSGWSSTGVRKTHTFTGAIRDNATLATTIIQLTWDASNPEYTVKAKQKHIPPPRKLSAGELESYRER